MSAKPASEPLLTFYAVKNSEGQFFRAKGYDGHGLTWVDSLSKARIYSKRGAARSQATYFASHYPQYGIPNLVALHVTREEVINEDERVKKSVNKIKLKEAEWKKRTAAYKLEMAREKLEEAKLEIEAITREARKL